MGKILVTLTPSEGKRLIAKAVATMESVQAALKKGTIVICLGTTNAFVLEEVAGIRVGDKGKFAIGAITGDMTCVSKSKGRMREAVIRDGEMTELLLKDAIDELAPEDVFIKGANALDPWGTAGVFLGSSAGGTLGASIGALMARGVKVIIPASVEKMVPYAIGELATRMGIKAYRASMGMPVGMMPLNGEVVTEVDAIRMIYGCEAFPVGAGGIGGGEGSRCYVIEGSEEEAKEAWLGISGIKGEARVNVDLEECAECRFKCRNGW